VRLLDHPNIVRFLDYGKYEGKTYFVMSLIRGISLATWLRSKFFSPLEVLNILQPLCSALDHAHARNVLHRDVKPSNILMDMTGDDPQIFLSDFGLSKVIGMISLTETQTQVGTPNYMSPEQVEDLPLTPATDVYSLAIVTYEMLLRELPFDARSDFEMTLAHVEKAPSPPSNIVPGFPSSLESVLLRGLMKDPEDRYAEAGIFCREFAEAVAMLNKDEQMTVYRYI
jgi:serine/threonine protein kinase